MIRTCRRCGREFDGYCNALYCTDCGLERKREIGCETFRRNYQPKPPRVCKCAICGKEFETQKRALYCSHECAAQARKAQRQKRYLEHRDEILTKSREHPGQRRRKKPSSLKCQRCGREFSDRAGTKYCPDCRPSVKRQWQHEHYCQKKSAVQSQTLIKKCENCGAEFQARGHSAKYCPDCRKIVDARLAREYKIRARAARQPVKKTCARCGKPFEVFEDSRRRFCFECYQIQQIERGARLQARLKTKPRVCVKCGREFTGMAHQKTCDDCLAEQKRETQRRIQERYDKQRQVTKPKSTGKSLDDWAREAAQCNLDYGTYRALIAAGRTFEQLKAEQRSPQFHSHCHSVNKN